MLNPPEDAGRWLLGDGRESGEAVCERLKESRFRKPFGRFGDRELGVIGVDCAGVEA